MSTIVIRLNGQPVRAEADPQTPLLYTLRNELGQHGPRFGCGLAQCGACINGWIMTAAALLEEQPNATDADLREGRSGLKCRCGTQLRVPFTPQRLLAAMQSPAGEA